MRSNGAERPAQILTDRDGSRNVSISRLLAFFCFGWKIGVAGKDQHRASLIRSADQFDNFPVRSRKLDSPHLKQVGLQEHAPNRLKLYGSKALVVNVEEKAQQRLCQVRIREARASEPLMRCRKYKDDVKTGGYMYPRISSGEACLLSGWRPA